MVVRLRSGIDFDHCDAGRLCAPDHVSSSGATRGCEYRIRFALFEHALITLRPSRQSISIPVSRIALLKFPVSCCPAGCMQVGAPASTVNETVDAAMRLDSVELSEHPEVVAVRSATANN